MRRIITLWQRTVARCRRRRPVWELSAATLARWLAEGKAVQLLDIRDASAFAAGHLPGAVHAPSADLLRVGEGLDQSAATVVY
jgi:rhodanese-related sulfurtransferase